MNDLDSTAVNTNQSSRPTISVAMIATNEEKNLPRTLAAQDVQFWLGRRPSTPDGMPCIGHASASHDIIHAYGHGHIGLGCSARTGRIVAQLLTGQAPEIDLSPFSAQRF